MTLDDAALDRLDRLAQAATPGPWNLVRHRNGDGKVMAGDVTLAIFPAPVEANATFQAAADPQTVRALVAEIRRLRGSITAAYGTLTEDHGGHIRGSVGFPWR